VQKGAKTLLLVDLDMSEYGSDINLPILKEIRENIDIELVCAGGIRTMESLDRCFEMGMNRVVLGVSAEGIYSSSIKKYGHEKVIVGIKAKGDEVLTDQKREFPLRVIDLAESLPKHGVTTVLFKDVWKEGTKIHPNYDEVERIKRMTPLKVYCSGGISTERHLKTLQDLGTQGVVIGKALYDNDLDLTEILNEFA
jgi:phosphoribosylformimino-5-aminoimidazole carboxamide ribotide isomerase